MLELTSLQDAFVKALITWRLKYLKMNIVDGGHHHRHVQRVPVEPAVLVARVQVVQHKLCAWELISLGSVAVQYEGSVRLDVHWMSWL